MKKEGIRIVLAIALSLVLLLGTVIVADAKGPPARGIIYTLQDWTPGINGTVNLMARVTWQRVNAFGIELGWEKWDVGSSAWVPAVTPNTWWWGYREPTGAYGAFTWDAPDGSSNTTYRAYCQLYDRKGNPISAKKNGYRVSAQQKITQAELTITMVPSLSTVPLDTPVSINVTVTNDGPDELTHCGVHDTWLSSSANTTDYLVTSGTTDAGATIFTQSYLGNKLVNWYIDDLSVGESAWVVITMRANTTGTLTHFAEIWSSEQTDSNYGSDNATVNLAVTDLLYPIPFTEDFTGVATLPAGWVTNNASIVYAYSDDQAGGSVPELLLWYGSPANATQDYWARTPTIDATNTTTALNLTFKHVLWTWDWGGNNFTYSVEVSNDGGSDWTAVLEGTVTEDAYPEPVFGPETANIDLSAYVGDTILVRWRLTGYTFYSDGWFIDDIIVDGY